MPLEMYHNPPWTLKQMKMTFPMLKSLLDEKALEAAAKQRANHLRGLLGIEPLVLEEVEHKEPAAGRGSAGAKTRVV